MRILCTLMSMEWVQTHTQAFLCAQCLEVCTQGLDGTNEPYTENCMNSSHRRPGKLHYKCDAITMTYDEDSWIRYSDNM